MIDGWECLLDYYKLAASPLFNLQNKQKHYNESLPLATFYQWWDNNK